MIEVYKGVGVVGRPDLDNIARLDALVIPPLMEMQEMGMRVDIPYLQQLTVELEQELEELRGVVCSEVPLDALEEFAASDVGVLPMNVESGDQVAKLVFELLKVGKGKQLKLTKGGGRLSTGKKQLEQLKREHPVIQHILDYRERSKIKSTYTEALVRMAVDSRVHTTFLTTRTTTGRLSSKNPNLQNIPTRTSLGRKVRAGFVASEGMELVSCDWSQVEMRLGGHYSQDANLLRIFQNDLDPHTDTAKRAFNTETPDKLTQRDPCKNVNFGVFYGLDAPGLLDLMGVTYATAGVELPVWLDEGWCRKFIDQWFELYPGVKGYIAEQHYRAYRYKIVWSLFGRFRRIPEVYSCHRRVVAAGLRQAGNSPIQGTCADMMRLAIAMVHDLVIKPARAQGLKCWMALTVHDEILIEVEKGYGSIIRDQVLEVMESVGRGWCRVPIKASGKVMERWEK